MDVNKKRPDGDVVKILIFIFQDLILLFVKFTDLCRYLDIDKSIKSKLSYVFILPLCRIELICLDFNKKRPDVDVVEILILIFQDLSLLFVKYTYIDIAKQITVCFYLTTVPHRVNLFGF